MDTIRDKIENVYWFSYSRAVNIVTVKSKLGGWCTSVIIERGDGSREYVFSKSDTVWSDTVKTHFDIVDIVSEIDYSVSTSDIRNAVMGV